MFALMSDHAAIGRLNDWTTAKCMIARHKSARPSGKYASEERHTESGTEAAFLVFVEKKHGGLSNQCWINLSHRRDICSLNLSYRCSYFVH